MAKSMDLFVQMMSMPHSCCMWHSKEYGRFQLNLIRNLRLEQENIKCTVVNIHVTESEHAESEEISQEHQHASRASLLQIQQAYIFSSSKRDSLHVKNFCFPIWKPAAYSSSSLMQAWGYYGSKMQFQSGEGAEVHTMQNLVLVLRYVLPHMYLRKDTSPKLPLKTLVLRYVLPHTVVSKFSSSEFEDQLEHGQDKFSLQMESEGTS